MTDWNDTWQDYKHTFEPSFWFMLKLRLFGKKITEQAGQVETVFYIYKGKTYMTKYGVI